MRKRRILTVDDSSGTTALIKHLLERTGHYEVLTENDARAALDAARRFRPDFIILDMVMPEKDGTDIINELREDAELRSIPVALLTSLFAKAKPGAPPEVIDGVSMLGKPPSADELVAIIEAGLQAKVRSAPEAPK